MTQFARPISDITSAWSALNWTDAANLWGSLTEPVADDTRGIRTGNNPNGVEYEALLSTIGAPADASNMTLRVRLMCTAGTADCVLRIRQGTTEIASTTAAVTTTTTTFTLSVPVASITDYSDLRVELVATKTSGGSMNVRCFWISMDAADDTGPAMIGVLRAISPWALYRFREGGGAVANDDVGNAHLAAADGQGTAYAARPTFGLATFLPDGSDTAAAFDGVNDEVESAGFTAYIGNGTIVLLLRGGVVANRAANETLFRCQTAGAAGLIALQWGASGQYVLHWRNDAGSGSFTDLWTPAEDEVDLIFFVTNGTDLRVFRNDVTTSQFTTTAQTAQRHDEIGVGANKTSDALAEFDIQTLAVFRSALTETNRLDIHAAMSGGGGTTETVVHSTDVLVRATETLVHGTDLVVQGEAQLVHGTDMVLRAETQLAHGTDVVVQAETQLVHSTDLVVQLEAQLVHGTDLVRRATVEVVHGTDVAISEALDVGHGTDVIAKALGTEISHTADVVIRATEEQTHGTDLVVRALEVTSHSTDLILQAQGATTAHGTDLIRRATDSKSHGTDLVLQVTDTVLHQTDVLVLGVIEVLHGTDLVLQKTTNLAHGTDIRLFSGLGVAHETDLIVQATVELAHQSDVVLVDRIEASHGTDLVLLASEVTSHGTDLMTQAAGAVAHGTDLVLSASTGVEHQTDLIVLASKATVHGTDVLVQSTSTSSHGTDVLVLAAEEAVHGTDLIVSARLLVSHGTDVSVLNVPTIGHGTDLVVEGAPSALFIVTSTKRRSLLTSSQEPESGTSSSESSLDVSSSEQGSQIGV